MEALKKALWEKAVKETQRNVKRLREANRKRYNALDSLVGFLNVLELSGAYIMKETDWAYDVKKQQKLSVNILHGWSNWNVHVYMDVKGFTTEHDPKLAEFLETLLDAGCENFRSEDYPSSGYRVYTSKLTSGVEIRVEATLQDGLAKCKRVKVKTEWVPQDTYKFVCDDGSEVARA